MRKAIGAVLRRHKPGEQMMHKTASMKRLCCGGVVAGILLVMIGFFGQKAQRDGADIPGGAVIDFILHTGTWLMVLGIVLLISSFILGNMAMFHKAKPEHFLPYLLIVPALVFLIVFTLYPMINLVYLSVFQGNVMRPTKAFLGLKNYNTIFFVKKDFLVALKNTAVYTGSVVVLLIFFAVVFALWMYKDRRINRFAQTALFTPHLIAAVSCAYIWSWIMDQNSYGLLNSLLKMLGLPMLRWLESSDTAMMSIVIVNVWKSIGYYALIVLSAMKSIPLEIYEAAELDNTPPLKRFFKITLPMLSPQLFFLLITITINSFKVFDSINVMTEGGPGTSTEVISRYIYDYAFIRSNTLGIGAAAGVVMMVILMLLTLVYFRGLENKVHYQ